MQKSVSLRCSFSQMLQTLDFTAHRVFSLSYRHFRLKVSNLLLKTKQPLAFALF